MIRGRRIGSWKAHVIMFGSLLLALAICIAHHVLSSYLHGKDVEAFKVPQAWVRDIVNAFAKAVQVTLGISVGVVLTQSIWFYVRGNNVTLSDLDTIFSLPSFSSVPTALFNRKALPILLLAAVIEALSLVGIFAPNALTVVPAGVPINSTVVANVPDANQVALLTSSDFEPIDSSGVLRYIKPSSTMQSLAAAVLNGSTVLPSQPPVQCGRGCSYHVDYWGPALKCTEIPQSSIEVYNTNYTTSNGANATVDPSIHVSNPTHFMEGSYVYNATTSFDYHVNRTGQSTSFLQSSPYGKPLTIDVIYALNSFTLPFTPSDPIYYNLTGYSCSFVNASYTASYNYSSEEQTTVARVTEYGSPLGPFADPGGVNQSFVYGLGRGSPIPSDQWRQELEELTYPYSVLALADAFSRQLFGTLAFSKNATDDPASVYPSLAFDSVFTTHSTESGNQSSGSLNTLSLSLISTSYDNLGRLLEDACTNLTASLISTSAANTAVKLDDVISLLLGTSYTSVSAIVIPDTTVYQYQASRLWIVYGVALAVALLADTYGFFCMFRNDGAMQRQFSAIAASVRDRELDGLFSEPGKALPARAKTVKLRYTTGASVLGERAGFKVTESEGVYEDGDGMEMHEAESDKEM
ncbi:unnamed protein product [Peniophora sp. CBMAI 1063]|nr:unnamed protein product [Peniophora sp. CBMAI 1063]